MVVCADASGFAELGEEGRARQRELQALCARAGVVLCGPNCLGLVNVRQRYTEVLGKAPESALIMLPAVAQGTTDQDHSKAAGVDEPDEPPAAISCGDRVVVERLEGLTLTVRPAEAWELL